MGAIIVCSCCAACEQSVDTFDRSSSTDISTGSPHGWTEQAGDWEILAADYLGSYDEFATATSGFAIDVDSFAVRIVAVSLVWQQALRIVFDFTDTDNFLFWENRSISSDSLTPARVRIVERSGGAETDLVLYEYGPTGGATWYNGQFILAGAGVTRRLCWNGADGILTVECLGDCGTTFGGTLPNYPFAGIITKKITSIGATAWGIGTGENSDTSVWIGLEESTGSKNLEVGHLDSDCLPCPTCSACDANDFPQQMKVTLAGGTALDGDYYLELEGLEPVSGNFKCHWRLVTSFSCSSVDYLIEFSLAPGSWTLRICNWDQTDVEQISFSGSVSNPVDCSTLSVSDSTRTHQFNSVCDDADLTCAVEAV